ncbi:hypothetical protein CG747_43405 [Streptomyces sp. CB02959]|nr:hypothetical protein CG747_43405 [Streptomyces sp. CB02959]
MRRHGLTPQRPARRSYRQQPEAVRAWSEEEYPAIVVRAKREQAELVRADRCGLRPRPTRRPVLGADRADPLVRVIGHRFQGNVMPAVASRGALWFTVFPGKFTAEVMCSFLECLARQDNHKPT